MSGRKGKFHKWLEPDNLAVLVNWAKDGLNDEQIAKNMGIGTTTLYVWKNKYREIRESLKKGKEVADIEVVNALRKRALGFEYIETQTFIEDVDGKEKKRMVKTTKYTPPDVTAGIFWLRNRQPDHWRGNPDKLNDELTKARIEEVKTKTKLLSNVDKAVNDELVEGIKDLFKMVDEPIQQRDINDFDKKKTDKIE